MSDAKPRNAVLLRPRALPVLTGRGVRSFFGGLPQLPPPLTWAAKVVDGRYRHLTLVAQIDLADVPRVPDSPLPASGTLYFFVDLTREWLEADDARVLFHQQSTSSYEECQAPLILQDRTTGHPWFWLEPGELTAHPSCKYPIQFVPFLSRRDEQPPSESLDEWTFETDDDEWPFAWAVIEHAVRALAEESDVTQEWLERASTQEPLSPPDASTCAAFRRQWEEWDKEASLLREAVRLTCCLIEEQYGTFERVPEKYRRAIERGSPVSLHQMLGYGEAIQLTPIHRADDVLLLQIKSDMYLQWWPDADPCGVIQFWISREDLVARRFDKVEVNFDCT